MRANSLGVIGPRVNGNAKGTVIELPVMLGPSAAYSMSPEFCRRLNGISALVSCAALVYNVFYVFDLLA